MLQVSDVLGVSLKLGLKIGHRVIILSGFAIVPTWKSGMLYVNKFALAANLKQKTAQGRGQELYLRVQFLLRVLLTQNPLT